MNTQSKTFWLAAMAASVALHFVALGAIAYLVTPDPFETQNLPKSQIDIKTQDVKRVAAQETQTAPEAANESKPESKTLGLGAFPKSNAATLQTAGLSVPTKPLPSQKTSPSEVPTIPTAPVVPQKTQIATSLPKAVAEAAKPPPSTTIKSTQPRGETSAQLKAPAQESNAIPATGEASISTSPSDQAIPSASLDIPSEQGQASLAWSGGDNAVVEAASLSAIQAFMQPSDLMQAGGAHSEVRDGIATILASVPCARLQATFLPETGQLELRGHIPEDALRGPVLAALKQQIGSAIPVTDQLLILPRPQCSALSGIADVGLPQSTEQLTNPRVIGASGFAQNYTYFAGQRLSLELVAPDYDGYVYVDFFTADGMVIHLQPNEIVPLEFSNAKSPLSVGTDRGDKPSLELTIGPPYGQEIAAAFASSVVLYDDPRPMQEPAENYLEFLKAQVTEAREQHKDFKGEWVYFFISTAEQ
ncbi:DUF4384 domain-containing protein [Falsihalocynthiibacter sp. S25ZX9]|uniref:DUF4384 domain-containing protein n=1 Tax=Falsihalocynthiibacter sp. S25ZX9 TaxID=3240870 RepID=UPI0035100123